MARFTLLLAALAVLALAPLSATAAGLQGYKATPKPTAAWASKLDKQHKKESDAEAKASKRADEQAHSDKEAQAAKKGERADEEAKSAKEAEAAKKGEEADEEAKSAKEAEAAKKGEEADEENKSAQEADAAKYAEKKKQETEAEEEAINTKEEEYGKTQQRETVAWVAIGASCFVALLVGGVWRKVQRFETKYDKYAPVKKDDSYDNGKLAQA